MFLYCSPGFLRLVYTHFWVHCFTLVNWLIHPRSSMLTGQLGLTLFIIVPMTPTISISHCQCLAARQQGATCFEGPEISVEYSCGHSVQPEVGSLEKPGIAELLFWFPHGGDFPQEICGNTEDGLGKSKKSLLVSWKMMTNGGGTMKIWHFSGILPWPCGYLCDQIAIHYINMGILRIYEAWS